MDLLNFVENRANTFGASLIFLVAGLISFRMSKFYRTYMMRTIDGERVPLYTLWMELIALVICVVLYVGFWDIWRVNETTINDLPSLPFFRIIKSVWTLGTTLIFTVFVYQVSTVENTIDIYMIITFILFAFLSLSIEQMVIPGKFVEWQSYFKDTAVGLSFSVISKYRFWIISMAAGFHEILNLLTEFLEEYRLASQPPPPLHDLESVQVETCPSDPRRTTDSSDPHNTDRSALLAPRDPLLPVTVHSGVEPHSGYGTFTPFDAGRNTDIPNSQTLVNSGAQTDESDGLNLVLENLNSFYSLCEVLGLDFANTIRGIQPTVDCSSSTKKILNAGTLDRLPHEIHRLKELKRKRMHELQNLAATLLDLWNFMTTPLEEKEKFYYVTQHIAASENELSESGILSSNLINMAKAEVERLRRMKLIKRTSYLQELWAGLAVEAHNSMLYTDEAIGTTDISYLLEQIELQILKVEEHINVREDICRKVDVYLAACSEDNRLVDYSMGTNRYKFGAARKMMKKITKTQEVILAMGEALHSEVKAWEEATTAHFFYKNVHLVCLLNKYGFLKQKIEQERRRQRVGDTIRKFPLVTSSHKIRKSTCRAITKKRLRVACERTYLN